MEAILDDHDCKNCGCNIDPMDYDQTDEGRDQYDGDGSISYEVAL